MCNVGLKVKTDPRVQASKGPEVHGSKRTRVQCPMEQGPKRIRVPKYSWEVFNLLQRNREGSVELVSGLVTDLVVDPA